MGSLSLDLDPGGQNRPTKIYIKKLIHFLKCWMFFEGWRLLLYLGRPLWSPREKQPVLEQTNINKIFGCIFFFLNFWSSKPWIRIRINLKCWIYICFRIRIQWIRIHNTAVTQRSREDPVLTTKLQKNLLLRPGLPEVNFSLRCQVHLHRALQILDEVLQSMPVGDRRARHPE